MNDEEARFTFQEQFGRPYNEDEFLIFNVAVRYPETIVSFHEESHHKASYYIHYYVKSWNLLLALLAILIFVHFRMRSLFNYISL